MAEKTIIAWTNHTQNFWWGCTKVSPGCKNCYADTLAARYGHDVWGPGKSRRQLSEANWNKPFQWNREAMKAGEIQRVFCGSMMDWAEDHPVADELRPRMFDTIRRTPWLDWQLLTKRAERIKDNLPADWGQGYPNVWLGVSIENNDYAWRADHLRDIPAKVRFISYEPALGPLDQLNLDGLHWIIYGGESGSGYRPEDKQWARDMNRRCEENGIAFFHKQSAAYRTEMGVELDGKIVRHYPREGNRIMLPMVA